MSVMYDVLSAMGICLYIHNTEKALKETLKRLDARFTREGNKKGLRELHKYKAVLKNRGNLIQGVRYALEAVEEDEIVAASLLRKNEWYEVVLTIQAGFDGVVTEGNLLEWILFHCSNAMGWKGESFCVIPRKDVGFNGTGYILEV